MTNDAYQNLNIPGHEARNINPETRVPWTGVEKLRPIHDIELIGWPLRRPFSDPSAMGMSELETLAAAVRSGTCYFQSLTRRVCRPVVTISRKYNGKRGDYATTRGRQLHPFRPQKKNGKVALTDEMIGYESGDDPIEDWE